jgi:hypothetical protein
MSAVTGHQTSNVQGNASTDALEHDCLRQLLNAHVRLQNRWLAQEKSQVDSFALASTAATEADEQSPTPSSAGEQQSPLLGSHTSRPTDAKGIVPLSLASILPPHPVSPIVHGMVRETRVEHIDGHIWVHWPVDARKIRCKDRQIISPSFDIFPGASFKMMILPKLMGDRKGQACFQKARGCGTVVLKLAEPVEGGAVLPQIRFRISIGHGEQRQLPRGPVEYDFSSSVCGLSKCDELWDFLSAVDTASSTLTVSLEVLPSSYNKD